MSYINGKIIKELRENKKLTQKQLGEIISVSDKTISKLETEKEKSFFLQPGRTF